MKEIPLRSLPGIPFLLGILAISALAAWLFFTGVGAAGGSPDAIRTQVGNVLASYGNGSGHVFNLGHGMSPDMNPDHVGVLVDAVHAQSARAVG